MVQDKTLRKNSGAGLAAAAFMAFFIFGFSDVLKGTAIPEIIAETSVGYNTGGALIGFTYFGFFAGTLSSVLLLRKRQAPWLMGAAVITACAGLGVFSIAPNIGIMFIAAFLIGIGGGLIDVTANLTIRMSADESKLGQRLNQLAFFHGSGAIVSPLFAGLILSLTARWRRIYFFAAILTAVIVIIMLALIKRAGIKPAVKKDDGEKLSLNPSVALLGGILFFYMTLEAGISGWIVEYGRTIGLGSREALFNLSLFFILLTAGRFLSSFYVDKLGLHRSILFNFIIILGLSAAGIIFRELFILIPCAGLFMAPIFPTTVALISIELGSSNVRILGFFFALAGLGGIFGPWMIGMLAKGFSLQTGLALLMVFAICAITICVLFSCVSGRGKKIQLYDKDSPFTGD